MSTPDTPLFVKTHDFLLWLIRHTQRFLVPQARVQLPFCRPLLVHAGLPRPGQPHRFSAGQDSVAVRHLAVLPFAV